MLNFRNTTISFIVLLCATVILAQQNICSYWLIVMLIFVYSLILFYGCYFVSTNFFIKLHNSGNTSEKIIALTFDDGPDAIFTLQILTILKEHQVKATFFCIGNRISGNEAILKQIHDEGHLIGNHSFSHHFWFDLFSTKKMLADLQLMDHEVEQITGHKPNLFRPPYGVTNPNVAKAIRKGNYIPVGWSFRSMDTVIKDSEKLFLRVKEALCPGTILLFHDTMEVTVEILPRLIREAIANGYTFVRVDELLDLEISSK